MTDYEKINLELRGEIKLLINDLIKSNDGLIKSNDDLKQKSAYYENPHFSPSQNSLQWRKQKAEKRQNKERKSNRDGIPRHKDATQIVIPQKTQHHKLFACSKCHGTNITQIKPKRRTMVAIPPPQQYMVTEYVLHRYNCQTCNVTFQNDGNLLPTGDFDGSVIRNEVNMFSKRMSYDIIRASLQEQNG